jgi:hypothetical protein
MRLFVVVACLMFVAFASGVGLAPRITAASPVIALAIEGEWHQDCLYVDLDPVTKTVNAICDGKPEWYASGYSDTVSKLWVFLSQRWIGGGRSYSGRDLAGWRV